MDSNHSDKRSMLYSSNERDALQLLQLGRWKLTNDTLPSWIHIHCAIYYQLFALQTICYVLLITKIWITNKTKTSFSTRLLIRSLLGCRARCRSEVTQEVSPIQTFSHTYLARCRGCVSSPTRERLQTFNCITSFQLVRDHYCCFCLG